MKPRKSIELTRNSSRSSLGSRLETGSPKSIRWVWVLLVSSELTRVLKIVYRVLRIGIVYKQLSCTVQCIESILSTVKRVFQK